MAECTFAPQRVAGGAEDSRAAADEKPLVIRGMGRYMELKQMAINKKQAQSEREKKAFCTRLVTNVDAMRLSMCLLELMCVCLCVCVCVCVCSATRNVVGK